MNGYEKLIDDDDELDVLVRHPIDCSDRHGDCGVLGDGTRHRCSDDAEIDDLVVNANARLFVVLIGRDCTLGLKKCRMLDARYGIAERLKTRRRSGGSRDLREDDFIVLGCYDAAVDDVVNVACCVTRRHFWTRDELFGSFGKLNDFLLKNGGALLGEDVMRQQNAVVFVNDELYCPSADWLTDAELIARIRHGFRPPPSRKIIIL